MKSNVPLHPPKDLSAWRKVALGAWSPIGDSQVYTSMEMDASKVLLALEEFNKTHQTKATLTHFLGKLMGLVYKEEGDLNCLVRLGRIYPRQSIDIFFHVVHPNNDLSGHVVRNIDQKSVLEIVSELSGGAKEIRSGNDKAFKKIKKNWRFIPGFMAGPVLKLITFIFYSLNIYIKGLGVPKDGFGSMMITNIGSLGIESAFVPLPPYTQVPLIIALGKVTDRPHVENGEVVVRPKVSLCCTFDHRVIDGAHGAKMAKIMTHYFENPTHLLSV